MLVFAGCVNHAATPTFQKQLNMELVIHAILILAARHTTCKGRLYTYLHADVAVRILDDAYPARITDYDPSRERHCYPPPLPPTCRSPASARPWSRWHLQKTSQRKIITKIQKETMLKMPPTRLRVHITMVTSSSTAPILSICLN